MAGTYSGIGHLEKMTSHELRIEWQRHYGAEAPRRASHDLLVRGVAYRMQERAQGSLKQSTRRMLQTLARKLEAGGDIAPSNTPALTPGARLVREWRGRTHTVSVLDKGFEYAGERYRSLTQIATLITGTKWSGPRFFGLGAR